MVKASRRQIVILGALMLAGALSLYLGFRPRTPSGRPAHRGGPDAGGDAEDVPAIGLARLEALRDAPQDEAVGGNGQSLAEPPSQPAVPAPPAPPLTATSAPPGASALGGTAPPPMNVRFLGAVQAREGVWVAALLTDRKELLTGKEGDTVGNRYRIVKIGLESIDLVDVTSGRQRRVRLGGA